MKLPVQSSAAGYLPAGRAMGVAIAAALLLQGSSIPGETPGAWRLASAKLAPAVRAGLGDPGAHALIVQLRRPASPADTDAMRCAGAHITRRYRCLPMAAVTANGPTLARLVCSVSCFLPPDS